MHFRIVYLIKLVSVVRLDWVSAHDAFNVCTSHVHAFFMHTFSLFIPILSCVVFCSSSFFSLSLSQIDCTMAHKQRKSTPIWNPFQGSGTSSSDPPIPFHIWFRDEKAKMDFFENFYKRGVHPKRQVILSDFADTPLPAVSRTRGWESLLERPSRCPVVFIQVFYSNIHGIDTFVPQFATTFRGTRIVVTLDLISEILHVPRVVYPDYPGYDCLQTVFRDKLLSHFCETPSIWGGKLNTPCSGFAKGPRFLTW